ncbi:MAG: transketolase, partial [Planctomycetota bacterium]
WPPLAEALASAGLADALKKGKLATRRAYGAALKVAGDLVPQVCALDGDVSNSTFSNIFAAAHPDRFYECKIAEQNMVSAAAGLAAAGMIPFANTFAKFFARAYDQIELALISRANIKLVGSHAGISPCADGPSQMALADVAYFRSFGSVPGDDRRSPVCWQFQPADAHAAYKLTQRMIALEGPCYMRTHRPDVPLLYDDDADFAPGGMNTLRTGEDVALISAGFALHTALIAADLLAKQGIRAAVIDAYSLPLDGQRMIEAVQRSGGVALSVEDNYGGGLGGAVAEAVADHGGGLRAKSLVCRRIPKSARTPDEEFEYCGVSAAQVADHALAFLKRPAGR